LEEHKEEIEKCRPAEVGFLLLLQYREIASPKFAEAAGGEKEEKKSITEAHRDEALKFLNSQIIQFRDQVIEAERMRQIAVGVSRLNNTRRRGKGTIGMSVASGAGGLE
jgi:hypothetical protein